MAQKDQIKVDYVPTGDVLADGITKALPRTSFKAPRDQISVVDITERLVTRQLKDISLEALEALEELEEVEEQFDGGGSTTDPVLIPSRGHDGNDGSNDQSSAGVALGWGGVLRGTMVSCALAAGAQLARSIWANQ